MIKTEVGKSPCFQVVPPMAEDPETVPYLSSPGTMASTGH
jgi:hypothetical protein